MFDVIFTRSLPATDKRGARTAAYIPHRKARVTIARDWELGIRQQHEVAALALAGKLGWPVDNSPVCIAGESPDGRGYLLVYQHART